MAAVAALSKRATLLNPESRASDVLLVESSAVKVVAHGGNGATARPAAIAVVYWNGAATPTNAIPGDLWFGA